MISVVVISSIIWSLLLVLLYLVLSQSYSMYASYFHYRRQGIQKCGSFPLPLLGSCISMPYYLRKQSLFGYFVTDFHYNYFREQQAASEELLPKLPDVFMTVLPVKIVFIFNDPELVEQIYANKQNIDKVHKMMRVFERFLGQSLLFSPANEEWAKRRRVVATIFYKEKLAKMLGHICKVAQRYIKQWKQENLVGGKPFELHQQVYKLLIDVISLSVFGLYNEELTLELLQLDGSTTTITLGEMVELDFTLGIKRFENPLRVYSDRFDSLYLGRREQVHLCNISRCREYFRSLLRQRKALLSESDPDEHNDFLSLLLKEELFKDDEELIIDECLEFMTAGTTTTTAMASNLLYQSTKQREVRQRIQQEFQDTLLKEKGLDLKDQIGEEQLEQLLRLENLSRLTYLKQCINESLRYMAPVALSSIFQFKKTLKIGKYTMREGAEFCFNIQALHYNQEQWIEPEKFIPQRFDPSSLYYYTPTGGKRHPMSFLPFEGGQRVCLGKTFVEYNSKILMSLIFKEFDFEFEDDSHLSKRVVYHVAQQTPEKVYLILKPTAEIG